jgi:hypothetical protein
VTHTGKAKMAEAPTALLPQGFGYSFHTWWMSCLLTAGMAPRTSRHFRRQCPQGHSRSPLAEPPHVYIAPSVDMFKEILPKTHFGPVIFIKTDHFMRPSLQRNALIHNKLFI